jgi:uncharacterized protein YecA (UPF0149 family)
MLEREHPELFAMLEKIFRQDMRSRAKALWPPARAAGRNMPCPCGSGKRYRNCCRDAPGPAHDRVGDGEGRSS